MKACPNIHTSEWKFMVSSLGEKEAWKLFIAMDYEIPSMEKLLEIINSMGKKMEVNLQIPILKLSKFLNW